MTDVPTPTMTSGNNRNKRNKKSHQVRIRRQQERELQIIDRPPDATDWTTLPNVLITHIAQSYLNEGKWMRGHPTEVIPFALTCRHICRVLTITFRWHAPNDYFVTCDAVREVMYVANNYPHRNHWHPSRYLASWPIPPNLPRQYLVPYQNKPNSFSSALVPASDEVQKRTLEINYPERYIKRIPTSWQMQTRKKMQQKKHKKKKAPFITHAERHKLQRQQQLQRDCATSFDSVGISNSPTSNDIDFDSDSQSGTDDSERQPLYFSFGVIGRRTLSNIRVYRCFSSQAQTIENGMKYGSLLREREEELQPLNLNWLPQECQKLTLGETIRLPPIKMTSWSRLHTIKQKEICRADLMRPPSQWPPQLLTLIIESNTYRSYMKEQADDEAGIEWHQDPAHTIDPQELTLPPTLTELELPGSIFSSDRYRLDPDLIPWPKGLKKLTYCGAANGLGWKLPDSLIHLTTQGHSNFRGWIVPPRLQSLKLREINSSLNDITWPADSLTDVILTGYYFHSLKDARLPESLSKLTVFSQSFAQPLSELVFPSRLTSLTLQLKYETPLNDNEKFNFPDSITHLSLQDFNVPIDKIHLPASLATLSLPFIFNHPIEGTMLPAGLTQLSFGNSFNHPIEDVSFPVGITKLSLGASFTHPIERATFPPLISELSFGALFNQPIEKWQSPPSLTSLHFGAAFNQPIEKWQSPPSLTSLHFGAAFNQPVISLRLPSTLTDLKFGSPIRGWTMPENLISLDLGAFNHPLKGVKLPSRLCELRFSLRFNQVDALIKLVLPQSMTRLTLPAPERFVTSPSYSRYREYVESLEKTNIQVSYL